MASGIFIVLDDITVLLKEVAAMSKVAVKNTAGILGDDLAVNAEKATGFAASRELPVIWAICKGSLINKIIILPIIFLISAFMPWLVVPILLVGGVYLCYEGAEKVYEWLFHHESATKEELHDFDTDDLLEIEKKKIKSAIRTDFVLSIEIVVITLGSVLGQSMILQIIVVSIVAIIATIGVYGFVALLVRMDDVGLFLQHKSDSGGFGNFQHRLGEWMVNSLPHIITGLTVIGCLAMFLVGGGMFVHNLEFVHHLLGMLPGFIANLVAGIVVGMLALLLVKTGSTVYKKVVN